MTEFSPDWPPEIPEQKDIEHAWKLLKGAAASFAKKQAPGHESLRACEDPNNMIFGMRHKKSKQGTQEPATRFAGEYDFLYPSQKPKLELVLSFRERYEGWHNNVINLGKSFEIDIACEEVIPLLSKLKDEYSLMLLDMAAILRLYKASNDTSVVIPPQGLPPVWKIPREELWASDSSCVKDFHERLVQELLNDEQVSPDSSLDS